MQQLNKGKNNRYIKKPASNRFFDSGGIGAMALVTALIIPIGGFAFDPAWWNESWQYRKKLTIDYTKVDDSLTDFPVLVKFDSDESFVFSNAKSDGTDIRFIDHSGESPAILKYERERWNSGGQAAEVWVKIPSVSSSAGTDFYLYYGNSGASDGQDAENVWDSNHKGVWHLKEDPSGSAPQIYDSTVNNKDGTSVGSMTSGDQVAGKIDGSLDFDGTNDRIEVGSPSGLNPQNAMTVEAWVKLSSSNSGAFVSYFLSSGNNRAWDLSHSYNGAGLPYFQVTPDGSTKTYALGATALSVGTWYYLTGVYNDSQLSLYLNGAVDSNGSSNPKTYSSGIQQTTAPDFTIGAIDNPLNWFAGVIDEVRVSIVARSAAWIKASYYSGNDNLLAYASDVSLPVELTSFTARQERSAAVLEWITESEIDNLGFILERRKETGDWAEIASYLTNPELQGQGSVTHQTIYEYIDGTVAPNTIYEYRLADVSYDGVVEYHRMTTLAIIDGDELPDQFTLKPAYPNPFNPAVTIQYYVPVRETVSIVVYDLQGRAINHLAEGISVQGWQAIIWTGSNEAGENVGAGMYLIRVATESVSQTQKVIYLK